MSAPEQIDVKTTIHYDTNKLYLTRKVGDSTFLLPLSWKIPICAVSR